MLTRIETTLKTTTLNISRAILVASASALLLLIGCSSAPPAPPPLPANLLTQAGFKNIAASTAEQKAHLQRLPVGQVTVVSQNMKNYFVYPDAAENRLWVGTEKEYQAYMRLRAQNNPPAYNPEASYFKQDANINLADKQDASVTWGWWPGFSGLGWQ
jgi:hypothetical protein